MKLQDDLSRAEGVRMSSQCFEQSRTILVVGVIPIAFASSGCLTRIGCLAHISRRDRGSGRGL
jgi:hypothetical protein